MGNLTYEIKEKSKSIKLYYDGEFAGNVTAYEIAKFNLKPDMEIDEDKLESIIIEGTRESAFNYIVKLTSAAMVSKAKVRKKLLERNYHEQVIDYVITKAEEYKYLDDISLASAYMETKLGYQSKLKVKDGLNNMGIGRTIFDKVYDENKEDYLDAELEGAVSRVLDIVDDEDINYKVRDKIYRSLASRGYSSTMINNAIKVAKERIAEDNDYDTEDI